MEILLVLETTSDFTRTQERVFLKNFYQAEEDYNALDYDRERNFF